MTVKTNVIKKNVKLHSWSVVTSQGSSGSQYITTANQAIVVGNSDRYEFYHDILISTRHPGSPTARKIIRKIS